MSLPDLYQLDAFNHARDRYEVVTHSRVPSELRNWAETLGLKAWRVWNRTQRAKRDRMLPPVSAMVNTFHHARRFSRIHKSPAKRSKEYERFHH